MTRATVLALVALAFATTSGDGQTATPAQPHPATPALVSPFPVGERLFYEVVYGPFRLGTAELTVVGIETIRGKPAVHVHFRPSSTRRGTVPPMRGA